MTKKEKFMSIILVILILMFIFVILYVIANKKENNNIVEEVNNSKIDYNGYIYEEDISNIMLLEIYNKVNLKKVIIKNLSNVDTSYFDSKQLEIEENIKNNLDAKKSYIEEYIKKNNISKYENKSTIDTIILGDLNNDILSILYLVEDNLDYSETETYITNIFIDVKQEKLLNNDELLLKFDIKKEDILEEIYDNTISNNATYKNSNKEELIKKLSDNFDEYIYLYLYEENMYCKYNKKNIIKLLFNEESNNNRYSTTKINLTK